MTDKVTEILEQIIIQAAFKWNKPRRITEGFEEIVKAYLEWARDPSNTRVKENTTPIDLYILIGRAVSTASAFNMFPPYTINRNGYLVLNKADIYFNDPDEDETSDKPANTFPFSLDKVGEAK